jgi:hypothetical protein
VINATPPGAVEAVLENRNELDAAPELWNFCNGVKKRRRRIDGAVF